MLADTFKEEQVANQEKLKQVLSIFLNELKDMNKSVMAWCELRDTFGRRFSISDFHNFYFKIFEKELGLIEYFDLVSFIRKELEKENFKVHMNGDKYPDMIVEW